METPSYYAVIPASIRYDKSLNSTEKLFYAEITALSNKEGYCFASNEYFSELYSLHPVSVSRIISKLADKGYITVRITNRNKRIITIGFNINVKGDKHKCLHNNIINNKYIREDKKEILSDEKIEDKKDIKKLPEEDVNAIYEKFSSYEITKENIREYYEKIIDYEKSKGKKYKDYPATVRSWIRSDIDKKKIKKNDPNKIVILEAEYE